jgi:hypothetical protein
MNIRVIAALVAIAGQGAQAEEADSLKMTVRDARVIFALKAAWTSAQNGTKGIEASFRLDGTPSDYVVVSLPSSNEFMNQRIRIVPGKTFAVFHVHPQQGEAVPSQQDKTVADKYRLKVVTIHFKGLYEYDPVTRKTTKLGESLEWTKASKVSGASVAGL